MKALLLFSLFVLAVADNDYYTVSDNLDMEPLVGNVNNLQEIMDCLLDRAPCSDFLTPYRVLMPECVQQACSRCKPNHKYQQWRFHQALKDMLPQDYDNYRRHYDPDNKYFDAFEDEISKHTTRV